MNVTLEKLNDLTAKIIVNVEENDSIPHPTYLTPTLIKYNKKFRENSANSATEGYGATAPSRFRANKKFL